jgi:polyphosphate kinase
MLHFPYHSFDSVIDLLREAAIDPDVENIKITCYRLAPQSKIINALINAVRNGKSVTVVIELRARFDEVANLAWKIKLEEAGVKVLVGMLKSKVHAKICLIKKRIKKTIIHYGFVSTGNLNEKTALTYSDHCLLTSNKSIMSDVIKMFNYLENPNKNHKVISNCKQLLITPIGMRKQLISMIDREIKNATLNRKASIYLKLNSLSDEGLIEKLYDAARAGVIIKMIIRGICCMYTENKKFKISIKAISIVDEYLEHARVMVFNNNGQEKVYISSADWMLRNLDHRVECACPILDVSIKKEIINLLDIQLEDNVKARVLNNSQNNQYVITTKKKKIRSQLEIFNFLNKQTYNL